MESIVYRAMEAGDADAVSRLIVDAYTEFIAEEYSDAGRAEFTKYVQPAALVDRSRSNHFVLVAMSADRPAGVIELRDNDHVSLLFVDGRFQRQGIARELLTRALSVARPAKPGLDRVTVNSSRFGVPIYERLGFRQTGPERSVNGIVFIPMAHQLEPDPV
ncbi:MAG: GNAT family N-acetyltransferase [Acidobacteria bacterium]|jgi:GNAT superfamily N-acetyltransferase|nr:GNAT family N-acetyltransferase [Acidobacteriota bacterium]MDP7339618.1 GNAT family N-acetyltransferase [Vicinamibacterales bacterium]MDP7690217.1 GNAT family N-acetyltransferase [Vicinamibacterales bacterium]HJN45640.1 GNAT family N-acetyltransferase [Vicinamibacterales bacterium]|tara:strand:- start:1712 stop:2194 length:483 start_codon:yes stop_codon:yes gene_type:complete